MSSLIEIRKQIGELVQAPQLHADLYMGVILPHLVVCTRGGSVTIDCFVFDFLLLYTYTLLL